LMDIIASEEDIADEIDLKDKSEKLMRYINNIKDEREKTVIIKRFGLDGKQELTQKQIAAMLGISRSYVSRIEKKVIMDLKKKFKIDEKDNEDD
ncbi:MAG: helix-turn-helix domain-containing protein, partial [Clostridia bacterium]|nr:helix-turn-helix domain-containing protein [Clostridia bacterium]